LPLTVRQKNDLLAQQSPDGEAAAGLAAGRALKSKVASNRWTPPEIWPGCRPAAP